MLQESLVALGHEVHVFTTTDPQALRHEKNVYRIPSVPAVSKRRLGVAVSPALMETIKNLNLDVIHTHTEFSLGLLGHVVARRQGIAHVHTMHTIYEDYTHFILPSERLTPLARGATRRLCASFCNSAEQIIVPTQKMLELLRSYGVSKDVAIVPTGINLEKFSRQKVDQNRLRALRAQIGIAEKDKVIISIGRLSKEKNIYEVLRGLKDYLPQHSDVRFLLVGDGPIRKELERESLEWGLGAQVLFTGEQPWDEIARFYHLGDVFVSASQSETQGLTYIEALACGVPVVAKSDKCLEDVLYNGSNGYAFDSIQEMEAALDSVLFGSDVEGFRLRAQQSSEKFSSAYFAQAVLAIYHKVARRSSGTFLEVPPEVPPKTTAQH
jgi:1,2-diacylglycerol 3-alpha-glucosyltransferase